MPATALYAALLALLLVYLGVRTARTRFATKVGLGDGGNARMTRAMRAHANFAEYVPLALLLMYIMERHTNSLAWVHVLGIALVIARLAHAFGFGREPERFKLRVFGAGTTFVILLVEALRLLWVWSLSVALA